MCMTKNQKDWRNIPFCSSTLCRNVACLKENITGFSLSFSLVTSISIVDIRAKPFFGPFFFFFFVLLPF